MQTGYTLHIVPSEWRWVLLISVGLVMLAFTPFLLLVTGSLADGDTVWQFMGMLHNYRDGATYLSKMYLGTEGRLLIYFQHTPDPHNAALLQPLYPLLGQIAGVSGLSPIVLFHMTRVIAALFMYMTLYQLGATIWMRVRTRRVFFVLVAVSAGFGWLYALFTGGVDAPDLTVPEAFPFYSSVVNVHFPLTIACLALLASVVISAFKPGANSDPTMQNGGLVAMLVSLVLSFLYPQALLPIGLALVVFVLIDWIRQRQVIMRQVRWLVLMLAPAVPMAAYYAFVVMYNPAVAEWNRQNVTPAPSPLVLLIGLGLPLVIALPGIYRAVRRFEADGDRFMLIWLVVMLLAVYAPTNIQRRFAAGLMIPIVYFATRALEDYWFGLVNRRWRYRLFLAVIPLVFASQLFVLFTPVLPVLINQPALASGLFLQRDYAITFEWLRNRTALTDVVLAAPDVSVWLPGWAGARVVYGHPFETLNAPTRRAQVLDWYGGSDPDSCRQLLDTYDVRYVLAGPQEARLGSTNCLAELQPVVRIGLVTVYAP